jgi:peptidoglycan/LPS O-acetylase OafA/YrhL
VCYASFGKIIPKAVSWCLASVGKISYSIYLLHFAVIFLVKRAFAIPHIIQQTQINALLVSAFLVLPITLLLSLLTYSVIENPFLGLRKKYVCS